MAINRHTVLPENDTLFTNFPPCQLCVDESAQIIQIVCLSMTDSLSKMVADPYVRINAKAA
jgi:hypothetical protein